MKVEIHFDVGDKVWFIHPKTLKSTCAGLKRMKIEVDQSEVKIKYNVDVPLIGGSEECYVWNVFHSKVDLLDSL